MSPAKRGAAQPGTERLGGWRGLAVGARTRLWLPTMTGMDAAAGEGRRRRRGSFYDEQRLKIWMGSGRRPRPAPRAPPRMTWVPLTFY